MSNKSWALGGPLAGISPELAAIILGQKDNDPNKDIARPDTNQMIPYKPKSNPLPREHPIPGGSLCVCDYHCCHYCGLATRTVCFRTDNENTTGQDEAVLSYETVQQMTINYTRPIQELNLDNCKTTTIVGPTDEYTNLENLSLINAGLTTLKGFPSLPILRKLELSDNRISQGLNLLSGCKKLTHLNLSGNKIKDLETLNPLQEFENLRNLDLFYNDVTNIEDYRSKVFAMHPSLKYLDGFDKDEREGDDSDDEEDGEELNGNNDSDDEDLDIDLGPLVIDDVLSERSPDSSPSLLVSLFLLVTIVGNMIYGMFTDTSIKGKHLESLDKENWTLCSVCESMRPPRAWHCNNCDIFILKRDHHCTFFACCVGYYNHRYFMYFTLYIFYVIFLSTFIKWNRGLIIAKFVFPLATFVIDFGEESLYVFLIEINFIVGAFSGFLFFFHFDNILKGRITPEKKESGKQTSYNKSWKENMIEVFGANWYATWILPFIRSPLPGNGIEWFVNDKHK